MSWWFNIECFIKFFGITIVVCALETGIALRSSLVDTVRLSNRTVSIECCACVYNHNAFVIVSKLCHIKSLLKYCGKNELSLWEYAVVCSLYSFQSMSKAKWENAFCWRNSIKFETYDALNFGWLIFFIRTQSIL